MRIAALIGAVVLLLWHLWCGIEGLYTGVWHLGVASELWMPMPYSLSDEILLELAYRYGTLLGPLYLFDGAARMGSALAAGLAAALIGMGKRRRMIGGVLFLGVVLHGLTTVPGAFMALISKYEFDYVFYETYPMFESFMVVRFPLELLGIAVSFLLCSFGALAIAVLGKTPAPED